nr:MAG TPA: hypothetical protein [Bacteriophage sp.]DAW45163.1 MAG TPA: hypothetical protein [Bacteriophage sp.]
MFLLFSQSLWGELRVCGIPIENHKLNSNYHKYIQNHK